MQTRCVDLHLRQMRQREPHRDKTADPGLLAAVLGTLALGAPPCGVATRSGRGGL